MYSENALLDALTDLADELGQTPSQADLLDADVPSYSTYQRRFENGYIEACRRAGIEPPAGYAETGDTVGEVVLHADEQGQLVITFDHDSERTPYARGFATSEDVGIVIQDLEPGAAVRIERD